MVKYFTNFSENELTSDWVRDFKTYVATPYASFQDFGKELINIIVLPCKLLVLTIASMVESLISFVYTFYYYCRGLSDLVTQNANDGLHCAFIGLKTLGILLASFFYVFIFLLRLFSSFFEGVSNANHRYTPIPDARRDDIDAICEAMRRYKEYMLETVENRKEIWQILCGQNSELSAYSGQIATEYAKLENSRVTIKGVTYFQQTGISNSKAKCTGYSELLSLYCELVKMYPMAEFESWNTVEERRNITVRMVEEAHSAFEEHHMKLLGVAEELLTESGITVQRARNIIMKIEDRDKQATSIGVSYV